MGRERRFPAHLDIGQVIGTLYPEGYEETIKGGTHGI
jgi:hypothetical protein